MATIALVDDDKNILASVAMLLEQEGYHVKSFSEPAAALTALMTGHAYATSARTAMRMGPFAGYTENREHMTRVLRMHREEVAKIDEELREFDEARRGGDRAEMQRELDIRGLTL